MDFTEEQIHRYSRHILFNKLLTFDVREMNFNTLALKHDTHCPVCGTNPSITTLQQVEEISCKI